MVKVTIKHGGGYDPRNPQPDPTLEGGADPDEALVAAHAAIDTGKPLAVSWPAQPTKPLRVDGVKRNVLAQAYRVRAGIIGALATCVCGFPVVPYGTSSGHDERCAAHRWMVEAGTDSIDVSKHGASK